MSTQPVPIPQGAMVDQEPAANGAVPVPQGASIDVPGSAGGPSWDQLQQQGFRYVKPDDPSLITDGKDIYFRDPRKFNPVPEKLQVSDTTGLVPTPGISAAAKAIASSTAAREVAGTVLQKVGPPLSRAAGTAVKLARTPMGKAIMNKAAIGIGGAIAGAGFAAAGKWVQKWLSQ